MSQKLDKGHKDIYAVNLNCEFINNVKSIGIVFNNWWYGGVMKN